MLIKHKNFLKNCRYLLEYAVVKFALWFFLVIGIKNSANLAAKIAKIVGKRMAVNSLAYKNLSLAIPELNEEEKNDILTKMWDNLGRVVGEFFYVAGCKVEKIKQFAKTDEEAQKNIEFIIENFAKKNIGGIIFSGHMGNWEVGPKFLINAGINVSTVYRPLNNLYVENITTTIRGSELIKKGVAGSKKIIEKIKNGGFVIILVDQKVSEGQAINFFHKPAITTTSLARIALKYNVPLIPAYVTRIGQQSKFLVTIEKPLELDDFKKSNQEQAISDITLLINKTLEGWIKKHPEQWFWVHNRWKS